MRQRSQISHGNGRHLALIRSEILLGSREAARELGIDLNPTLTAHGIDPQVLESPEGYLPQEQVVHFLEEIADRFECPVFGFLVGKHQPPLQFGNETQLVKLAPTLGAALDNVSRFERLYTQGTRHALVVKNGTAFFRRWNVVSYDTRAVQLQLLGTVQVYKMIGGLISEKWRPGEIHISSSAPRNWEALQDYFGCPVKFDQAIDSIVFPEHDLASAIPTADAQLLEIVEAYFLEMLSRNHAHLDTLEKLKDYIRDHIGANRCNLESCAEYFSVHPKALQRELASQGYTFKQLLLEMRTELAKYYLRNSAIKLSRISVMLGYSSDAAFSRAFRSTQNMSPGQWRKVHTRRKMP